MLFYFNFLEIRFECKKYHIIRIFVRFQQFPYVMMHRGKNYTGNARFFGFCVDLLEMIAKQVGFDYILDLVPDNKYGAQDPVTLEWNGIVEQLIKHVSLLTRKKIYNVEPAKEIDFTEILSRSMVLKRFLSRVL